MFKDYKWLSPRFKRNQTIIKPMIEMLEIEGRALKILDAGCGNGIVSESLVKMGYEVWGIDENEEALKEAEKKGVKTFKGDLEKEMPFEDGTFDAIWCLRVLEHIFNTEHFLRECHRILKRNKPIIITADNIVSLPNRIRILFGLYPLRIAPSETYQRYTEHVRCFTKSTFEILLKNAGFKIEKIISDFVCFNPGEYNQPPYSEFLGKMFPSLGSTLIAKARKKV